MDPTTNPFAPGAGTRPPELAGRTSILESATVAIRRTKAGRSAKSQMLLGLRGVGKTVLLNRLSDVAEAEGFQSIMLEAPEDRTLAEMLSPQLRALASKLSRGARAKELGKRALAVLRSFTSAFKLSVGDVDFGVAPEEGTADSGVLESDLPEVIMAISRAAKEAETGIALFVDEVQYLSREEISALIVSAHKMNQKGLPFILFGAGLPQLAQLAGEAKSYAERLFDFPEVGPLSADAAREAIVAPIQREQQDIAEDAVRLIIERTHAYPYFLQEWGSHAWNVATLGPISVLDVEDATTRARAALDHGFFRVRLDRLTPREKDYVRAMAELGPGPHRSGEIAQKLGIEVTAAGPLRAGLIKKGMVYSPQHGETAFTVPLFDDFLRRAMPRGTVGESRRASAKRAAVRKPRSRR